MSSLPRSQMLQTSASPDGIYKKVDLMEVDIMPLVLKLITNRNKLIILHLVNEHLKMFIAL